MISFSEFKWFSEHDPAFKILKPWWDVFSEYLTILMFMIAMFSGGLQVTHKKILCVPAPEGVSGRLWNLSVLEGRLNVYGSAFKTKLDLQQYYLINQWCYDNAVLWFSKYFPYLALLHTMIFVISSNFWFKFPGTSSKIEHFVLILVKCLDSPWTTKALSETVYDSSPRPPLTSSSTSAAVYSGQVSAVSSNAEKRDSNDGGLYQTLFSDKNTALGGDNAAPAESYQMDNSAVKILDKKEGEQARALFEKVKKFRVHTEEGDILYKMYMRQTILRTLQGLSIVIYITIYMPSMNHIVHCVESLHITGYTDFYCVHGLWRIFTMLSVLYVTSVIIYTCTCFYTLYWIFYYNLKEYSFENIRAESGMDDIPDVKNDFAFLLYLIDQYDMLYARKFAVFLSDVSETKLLQLNLNHEYTLEKLKQRLSISEDNKVELHLYMLPGIPINVYDLVEIGVLKLELIADVTLISPVSNLKQLQELWLCNCTVKVEKQALAFLKENLRVFRVRFSSSSEIPTWMYGLGKLREIYLEGCLHNITLQPFRDLIHLRSIHLKSNISKVPNAFFDTASHLTHLSIHNQGAKLLNLTNVKKLFCLTHLRLLHCNMERIFSSVFSFQNLQELDLMDNNLKSTEELASGQQLRKLISLNLSHNKITSIQPQISKITGLEKLYLHKNKITALPPSLFKLSKLLVLDVSHNNLTEIPADIEQLSHLQHFIASNNSISGLPNELFSCTKLRVLVLSRNNITYLSPLVGQLSDLHLLDLKNNKLNTLPVELTLCLNLRDSQLLVEPGAFCSLPMEAREQLCNRKAQCGKNVSLLIF
ncbi:volume-regulated anion channel subunit LRRC8C-like [Acipenser oxyrinchus oxyrinchus]|uniref:Volume-regulated anion channel subunit LRRC8C-like n=1 Tax=Acipenser oxyrinchus oxyrinchus TaxID=40147 RepID=A0AAD8CNS3_ACIOX|nr:volume-regulated anion channel subunit LRRC8C-like [Acipenser oxyrinchus oxyrinchus]